MPPSSSAGLTVLPPTPTPPSHSLHLCAFLERQPGRLVPIVRRVRGHSRVPLSYKCPVAQSIPVLSKSRRTTGKKTIVVCA